MAGLKGKSAMDAVVHLTADVTAQWEKKLPTYACFMDIKGCFPNVRHDILVRRLREYYLVEGDILVLIADLLCNCWTTTVVNKSRSKWMVSRVGLGQGRTSSPLLNLLYLDPIFYVFRIMVYVDDIVMWSVLKYAFATPLVTDEGQHTWLIVDYIQREVRAIDEWLRRNHWGLSAHKTEAITFLNSSIKQRFSHNYVPLRLVTVDGTGKEHVHHSKDVVTYLGFSLASDLRIGPCEQRVVRKMAFAFSGTRRDFRKARGCTALCFRKVVDALVLSRLGYFGAFLDSTNTCHRIAPNLNRLPALRTLHRRVLRSLIGASKSTPIVVLLLLSDKPGLADWVSAQCAIYWSKLLHLPTTNPLFAEVDGKWFHRWRTCLQRGSTPRHVHTEVDDVALLRTRQGFCRAFSGQRHFYLHVQRSIPRRCCANCQAQRTRLLAQNPRCVPQRPASQPSLECTVRLA